MCVLGVCACNHEYGDDEIRENNRRRDTLTQYDKIYCEALDYDHR